MSIKFEEFLDLTAVALMSQFQTIKRPYFDGFVIALGISLAILSVWFSFSPPSQGENFRSILETFAGVLVLSVGFALVYDRIVR